MSDLVLEPARTLYRVGETLLLVCRLVDRSERSSLVEYPEDLRIMIQDHEEDEEQRAPAGFAGLVRKENDIDLEIGDIRLVATRPGQYTITAQTRYDSAEAEVIVLDEALYNEYWRSSALEPFRSSIVATSVEALSDLIATEILPQFEARRFLAQSAVSFELEQRLDFRLSPPEGRWSVPLDPFAWHAELLFQAALESLWLGGDLRIRLSMLIDRVVLQLTDTHSDHRGLTPRAPPYLEAVRRAAGGQSDWEFSLELSPEGEPTWGLTFTLRWDPMPPQRTLKPELAPTDQGSRKRPDEYALAR